MSRIPGWSGSSEATTVQVSADTAADQHAGRAVEPRQLVDVQLSAHCGNAGDPRAGRFAQRRLQLQSAHSRHAQIGQHAAVHFCAIGLDEGLTFARTVIDQ
jgi:hypothetical protein